MATSNSDRLLPNGLGRTFNSGNGPENLATAMLLEAEQKLIAENKLPSRSTLIERRKELEALSPNQFKDSM